MESTREENKDIISFFFKAANERNDCTEYWCLICRNRDAHRAKPYTSPRGNQNLFNHLESETHAHEWKDLWKVEKNNRLLQPSKIGKLVLEKKVSDEAANLFGWIEQVIMNTEPFSFVENKLVRKYSKLAPISVEYLQKYIRILHTLVHDAISGLLPDSFGGVFDGWDDGSGGHFVALFVVFPHTTGVTKLLLSCKTLPDLTTRDRFNHLDFFQETLAKYGKSKDNLNFLVGDNTALNPAIAREIHVPFIGCYSHRLNLAMNLIFKDHSILLDEVETIMSNLRSGNNVGILLTIEKERNKKTLKPSGSTTAKPRWSAKYQLIQRYLQLHEFLSDDRLEVGRLNAPEKENLKSLFEIMANFESVSKCLQREDTSLSKARALFEQLIEDYSHIYPGIVTYLGNSGMKSPVFEKAVIKIQNGLAEEATMTPAEKNQMRAAGFLREDGNVTVVTPAEYDIEEGQTLSYSDRVEQRYKVRIIENNKSSAYKSTLHVLAESNLCERLFSLSKRILGDRRKRMTTDHLDMLLVLNVNRQLWNINTVQTCLSRSITNDQINVAEDLLEPNVLDNAVPEETPALPFSSVASDEQ